MDYLECVEISPIKCNDSLIVIIALTLLMAVVVLGVSAHLLAIRTTDYWRFAALAVAVSSITLLTLPIILILSVLPSNGQVLMIAEGIWLTIMWILWLATGANATRASRHRFFRGACSFFTIYSSRTCNEFKVVQAFSYIIFALLLLYTISLFVYAASRRGDEGATRGGPETGQVKTAPGTQGQQ
ncbi:hypothetical protein M405DRAFT_142106 [Rhizopogon salebrosus TDB-379]|nr:hypothetical protein M405DRAFT_142106 [Rhizopogon salebrosus TDB-379]